MPIDVPDVTGAALPLEHRKALMLFGTIQTFQMFQGFEINARVRAYTQARRRARTPACIITRAPVTSGISGLTVKELVPCNVPSLGGYPSHLEHAAFAGESGGRHGGSTMARTSLVTPAPWLHGGTEASGGGGPWVLSGTSPCGYSEARYFRRRERGRITSQVRHLAGTARRLRRVNLGASPVNIGVRP